MGTGNDTELRAKNDGVWDAMEDLAVRIKQVDPIILSPQCLQESMRHREGYYPAGVLARLLSFQIYGEIDTAEIEKLGDTAPTK